MISDRRIKWKQRSKHSDEAIWQTEIQSSPKTRYYPRFRHFNDLSSLYLYYPVLDDVTKKEIETKAQVKNQHEISEQKDELSRSTGVFPFMLWFRYY